MGREMSRDGEISEETQEAKVYREKVMGREK